MPSLACDALANQPSVLVDENAHGRSIAMYGVTRAGSVAPALVQETLMPLL